MIDKNLLKDIFPFKRQLILVMISNIMQAMMIVAIAYIIAYIGDKLLLSRLEVVQQRHYWCCCFSFLYKGNTKLF